MSFLSSNWFHSVEQLAPIILATTPLAPIAPFVAVGIHAAESLPGADGPKKLAVAKQITDVLVSASNAQAGRQVVDPVQVSAAFSNGVGAVIAVANLLHPEQGGTASDPSHPSQKAGS